MKILQVEAEKKFRLLDLPIPEPGPDEVLMRIDAVTACPQWDLHLRHNEPMFVGHRFHYPYTPGQPGHEATGEIAVVGEGVTELQVGDRVSAWRDPGHGGQGCYAQYVVHDAANVLKVPSHLPVEATASLELAMCVGATFLLLNEMNLVAGRRFAINGLGPAGLIAAQMALAEGATEVVGFDLCAERCAYAVSHCGLSAAYDPRAADPKLFPTRPKRCGLDCGVDCVGPKASVEWLMDHVEHAVALFGVQRDDYVFAPRHYRNLRLCGYPGHSRAAAEYALRLIETGTLNLAPLVTHRLPMSRYGEGIDLLETQQAIKVCFLPWED